MTKVKTPTRWGHCLRHSGPQTLVPGSRPQAPLSSDISFLGSFPSGSKVKALLDSSRSGVSGQQDR